MIDEPHSDKTRYHSPRFRKGLKRRRIREHLLGVLGISAIATATGMLLVLFGTIASTSLTAFSQTRLLLPISLEAQPVESDWRGEPSDVEQLDYRRLMNEGLYERLGRPRNRAEGRAMRELLSATAEYRLRELLTDDPSPLVSTVDLWLPVSSDVDLAVKGVVPIESDGQGRLSVQQVKWIETLRREGFLETGFNWDFFLAGHSQEPEVAGIRGAVTGSALMLLVTLAIALPIGIAAAIYLEEFAPRNRFTELIDVNIRNLAAVPSIVFGILGVAVFLNLAGLPRSTPLAGGVVLALMTLPTIIITARAAIEAVPPSLREAALQLGASRLQATMLVVLPTALPGILTGTIIGAAQALGETAPLLMIGMVAFIAGSPSSFTDPAAPLPVQIFIWSTSPERGFVEKTAAGIMVLLAFLIVMNGLAVTLRNRSQRIG